MRPPYGSLSLTCFRPDFVSVKTNMGLLIAAP